MTDAAIPEWRSYEELTQELARLLSVASGTTTLRLERNVAMDGRANTNHIDVLWEVQREFGDRFQVLFECRSYARRIDQQALHSWRSIVDDVSVPGITTIGAMVTTTGYQSGAQRVADTYGTMILEVRAPTERDLANRLSSVRIDLSLRVPQVTDLSADVTEQIAADPRVSGALGEFFLDLEDGTSERLREHLLRDELSSIHEPPTAPHPVMRTFTPPALLRRGEEPIARVVQIRATVFETDAEPVVVETSTADIAWMLADTLSGSRIWFAADGRMWHTSS